MQRVRPRAKVKATLQPPPKRPDSPLGKLLTANRPGPAAGKPAGAR
jgi:hypothetical protein